jgi:hypothetical protein
MNLPSVNGHKYADLWAKGHPFGAKRLECVQLAAALDDAAIPKAVASCTHSKRFATERTLLPS